MSKSRTCDLLVYFAVYNVFLTTLFLPAVLPTELSSHLFLPLPCRVLHFWGVLGVFKIQSKDKTGLAGFEPASAGVKVLCLTAWR